MIKLDAVLARWTSEAEAFPEGLREREETSCCNATVLGTPAGQEPHEAP